MADKIQNILYIYLHSKMFRRFGLVAQRREVLDFMFEWRIPKKLRCVILEELFILGLIKKKNRDIIEIIRTDFNENECNHLYEELGLF